MPNKYIVNQLLISNNQRKQRGSEKSDGGRGKQTQIDDWVTVKGRKNKQVNHVNKESHKGEAAPSQKIPHGKQEKTEKSKATSETRSLRSTQIETRSASGKDRTNLNYKFYKNLIPSAPSGDLIGTLPLN